MSHPAFERARAYLLEQARPLERELFRLHFEGGASQRVLVALAAYRNPDGGFGNGLEPDYRAAGSSVLATCQALGRLEELRAPGDHPWVKGALDYLLAVFDETAHRWSIIPATGEREPHAPWWNVEGLEETFAGFRINPMAEVASYLWSFGGPRERSLAKSLLPALRASLAERRERGPSEFECLLHLYRSPMDDRETRGCLEAFLSTNLPRSVERDPARWASYCLKPLWGVPDPQGPGAAELQETLEQALDYEIGTQAEDGAWEPFWDWGDAFAAGWPVARREWRGWLALRNLRAFKAFDRLPHNH